MISAILKDLATLAVLALFLATGLGWLSYLTGGLVQ